MLSDFQLGLLGGPAFALLYILAAIPIARYAERGNRVTIVSLAFAGWSAMTAFSGIAASFGQLLIARVGVSIGEAGCAPPSHSLISDLFPPVRRTSALAIYGTAGPVGALVAATGGGWLAHQYGWRIAFLACGGVGILLALIFRLTMREPVRHHVTKAPSALSALRVLLGKRSFVAVMAAGGVAGFASYSDQQYMVSFLMRTHGLAVSEASAIMGIALGGVGIVVTLLTGPAIDRGGARFPRIRTWLPATGLAWSGLFFVAAFNVQPAWLAITLLIVASIGQHSYIPAMYSIAQDVAPPHLRATAAALLIAIISVVGYGIGPPLVGLASDVLGHLAMAVHGADAATCGAVASAACQAATSDGLRLSLSFGSIAFLIAALLFWRAGPLLESDLMPG